MKTVGLQVARRQVFVVWLTGSGAIFVLLAIQSASGHYGARVSDAWAWLLPAIMPSLSLITGVVVAEAFKTQHPRQVDSFLRSLVLTLSSVYIVVVAMTIIASPWALLYANITPIGLMRMSNLWLAPLQGIVTAFLGIFFTSAR